jgi:hypothetical protein
MQLINGKLYLTFSEAVDCGFKANYMSKVKSEQAKKGGYYNWEFLDDPKDKRCVLVGYDVMTEENKKLVHDRFGKNPYEYVIRQPILEKVINDPMAFEFFTRYRYDEGNSLLDPKTVNKYVRADAWLNMLNGIDRPTVRATFNVSVADFYLHAGQLVDLEKQRGKQELYKGVDQLPGDFPGSYQRLMTKASEYKKVREEQGAEAGYLDILDRVVRMTGNKISAKIGAVTAMGLPAAEVKVPKTLPVTVPQTANKALMVAPKSENKQGAFDQELADKQMAVIRYCCRLANNLNAKQVAKMVNIIFKQNGWETVSGDTILRLKKKNPNEFVAGNHGKRTYMNQVARQVKRKAPAYPMLYWTLDGWTAELMYKEYINGKLEYNRLVVVIVLDPCTNYPIGYAIGERENSDLIRMACRNAVHHTQELFGQPYQPLQLQSDNYAIKNLTPFYQAVTAAHFTPAQVGNAKAKRIEPYFMYLNKEYCQARHQNWSGFNVDARKENQVNREYLNAIKSSFPDRQGVIMQIMDIINEERAKKQEEYVGKWNAAPADTKRVMNVMSYLQVFGTQLGDRKNTITGQGLIKQIDGVKYTYDSFDPAFRANMGLNWTIYGVKDNLSHVLAVSPDEKLRFVLEQTRELPMDIYSTTKEDVDYRVKINHFNANQMVQHIENAGRDADITREIVRGTIGALSDGEEAGLKLMFTDNRGQQKEKIQDAKGLKQGQKKLEKAKVKEEIAEVLEWEKEQQEYQASKTDFSKYL